MRDQLVSAIGDALLRQGLVPVEVSARHVHLSRSDLETLFGPGAELTPVRELSQPGQFLSQQRVSVEGPKGKKERVAILGPCRSQTQAELSRTDCAELGVDAPLRESGKVEGSGAITLVGPKGSVHLSQGAIVALGHVHIFTGDAEKIGVTDGQKVDFEVLTQRPLVFKGVLIRVSDQFQSRMHLDFDEANAAWVQGFTLGRIIK